MLFEVILNHAFSFLGVYVFDADNFHAAELVSYGFPEEVCETAVKSCIDELLDLCVV